MERIPPPRKASSLGSQRALPRPLNTDAGRSARPPTKGRKASGPCPVIPRPPLLPRHDVPVLSQGRLSVRALLPLSAIVRPPRPPLPRPLLAPVHGRPSPRTPPPRTPRRPREI